ncbi:DUF551 domain-containing protein [Escherichia coli]|nr:DUF551 domain-containing protein [Escherichia coli]EJW4163388.1 DUF551 domain-containing protein [Escherichia coli]
MITITKERLLTIQHWRETYGPGSNVVLPAEEAEELARIALASLEAEPVAKIIAHYPLGVDVGKQKFVQAIRELPDFGGYLFAAPPAPIVPEEMYWQDAPVEGSSKAAAYATGWNDCREAMLQSGNFRENKDSSTNNFRKIPEASTSSPVTPALLPGGFTIEEAKELHEDLVRSHISKALSGEKMKKKDRDADLRWIHGVIVQAAWFVKASLEQNALSGNYPVTPDGWISCSDRMPEMGERQYYVLAADFKNNYPPSIPNTQVGVYGDWFNDGNPTWDDGDGEDLHLKEVTHWMPLPEPPQEVNRG